MCVVAEKNTQAQQYIFMLSDCKIFSSTKFPKEIFFQFPFSSFFRNFVISICLNHKALNSSAVNSVSSEIGAFFQYSRAQCEHCLSKDFFVFILCVGVFCCASCTFSVQRALNSLDTMWVLKADPRFSGEAVSALNSQDISPGLNIFCLTKAIENL